MFDIKYIIIAFVLIVCAFSSSVQAKEAKTVAENPTLEIIFTHLPKISTPFVRDMVAEYTEMAKAFWVYKKCNNLGGNAEQEFISNLAQATDIVRSRFQKEFNVSSKEAQKYAEIPQMWALNEMSAKKFGGCDKNLGAQLALEVVRSRGFIKKYQ